jgi:hypothetical protein
MAMTTDSATNTVTLPRITSSLMPGIASSHPARSQASAATWSPNHTQTNASQGSSLRGAMRVRNAGE